MKTIALLGACIGFGFGLYQYYDSNRKVFRKPVWEKQISLYFDATKAASVIATQTNGKEWDKANAAFRSLYYGELCIVEDDTVIAEMIRFKNLLDKLQREPNTPKEELQSASIDLAHACRQSISDTWSIELKSLDTRYDKKKQTTPK